MGEIVERSAFFRIPHAHSAERTDEPTAVFLLAEHVGTHRTHRRCLVLGNHPRCLGEGGIHPHESVCRGDEPLVPDSIPAEGAKAVVPDVAGVVYRGSLHHHEGNHQRRPETGAGEGKQHGEDDGVTAEAVVPALVPHHPLAHFLHPFLVAPALLAPDAVRQEEEDDAREAENDDDHCHDVYHELAGQAEQFSTVEFPDGAEEVFPGLETALCRLQFLAVHLRGEAALRRGNDIDSGTGESHHLHAVAGEGEIHQAFAALGQREDFPTAVLVAIDVVIGGAPQAAVLRPHEVADVAVVDALGKALVRLRPLVGLPVGDPYATASERHHLAVGEGHGALDYAVVEVIDVVARRQPRAAHVAVAEERPVVQNDA